MVFTSTNTLTHSHSHEFILTAGFHAAPGRQIYPQDIGWPMAIRKDSHNLVHICVCAREVCITTPLRYDCFNVKLIYFYFKKSLNFFALSLTLSPLLFPSLPLSLQLAKFLFLSLPQYPSLTLCFSFTSCRRTIFLNVKMLHAHFRYSTQVLS